MPVSNLSSRTKFIIVTATTLVPLAGVVLLVVALIFVPVFRTLETLTAQSLFEMIPLHELQLSLHRSTMAVRSNSADDFDRASVTIHENYRQLLGKDGLTGERRDPVARSYQRWQRTARLAITGDDLETRSEQAEFYAAEAEHLAAGMDELHAGLHRDIIKQLDEAGASERRGYVLLIAAFAVSISIGAVGSILLTRDRTRLEQRSLVDSLTGASNRKGFERAFRKLAAAKSEEHPSKFSLIIFDLDHFKSINDAHGHATGDMALKTVVHTVRQCLRENDHLARLGGDEFAVLVPNVVGSDALELAERVRRRVADSRLSAEDGGSIQLRLSVGVASRPVDGETIAGLLRAADEALYDAKRRGRDQAVARSQLRSSEIEVRANPAAKKM